jgi:acyl-CoA reductase-like NAD-dependent aldehyde dehydrogenase
VHDSIYDDFVERLVEKAARVTINWPDLHRGEIGPFIWSRQADIVQGQIDEALAGGARLLCGGRVEVHGGKWLKPTVLVDVTHEMKIMQEETFGPVMPVMRYRDVDEAIRLANAGIYGLSAAVIAGSVAEAEGIARRIDAGAVSINDGALTGVMHECEKNSFKCSGMGGTRMGPGGFTRFFRRKALIFQTATPLPVEAFDEANAAPKP